MVGRARSENLRATVCEEIANEQRGQRCPLGVATRIMSGPSRCCFSSLNINYSEWGTTWKWRGKMNITVLSRSLAMPERRCLSARRWNSALIALVALKNCSLGSYNWSIFLHGIICLQVWTLNFLCPRCLSQCYA